MKTPPPGWPAIVEAQPLDPAVEQLSEAARRLANQAGAPTLSPARWARLQETRARRARRARAQALAVALALPVLVGGAWGGWRWRAGASAVSYRIEGTAAVGEGGYIHDVAARGARLRFSDETTIDLAAGARAWVVSRGPRGARLRLENGRARLDVAHRPGARWMVDAGPFAVEVTGTAFDVTWTGADEELAVDLRRGEVIVRGPLTGPGGIRMRPGQSLLARLPDGTVRLDESPRSRGAEGSLAAAAAAQPPAAPGAARPDGAAKAGGPDAGHAGPLVSPADTDERSRAPVASRTRVARERRAATPAAPAPGPETWAQRVAAGDFRAVLDEAQRMGIDQCAAQCPLESLGALADAARYAGKAPLARRLMLAARDRFPGSATARAAAFLLGRMAEETAGAGASAGASPPPGAAAAGGSTAAAIDWYDRYLNESPDGAFVGEALGRKMLAIEKIGDPSRSRRIAVEYLRRFPRGTYAPQATAISKRP